MIKRYKRTAPSKRGCLCVWDIRILCYENYLFASSLFLCSSYIFLPVAPRSAMIRSHHQFILTPSSSGIAARGTSFSSSLTSSLMPSLSFLVPRTVLTTEKSAFGAITVSSAAAPLPMFSAKSPPTLAPRTPAAPVAPVPVPAPAPRPGRDAANAGGNVTPSRPGITILTSPPSSTVAGVASSVSVSAAASSTVSSSASSLTVSLSDIAAAFSSSRIPISS